MHEKYDNIPANLRYLRSTRTPNYSKREIAQKLHVSRSTYSRYESGMMIPPVWFLCEVAKFYSVDVADLFLNDIRRSEKTKNESIT